LHVLFRSAYSPTPVAMDALRASRSLRAPILERPIYSWLVNNSGKSLMNVVPLSRVLTSVDYWVIPLKLQRIPFSGKQNRSRLQRLCWKIIISEKPDTVVGIVIGNAMLTLGNIDRL